ncbi:MAG: ABC transporter ATP-binding protein [Cyanobacteria bacterium J06639_1]
MIEVEHLQKTYGDFNAIRDITFRVEPGEILGFLGPNGAGKTTTMRIVTGYLPATSGTARVGGFDVTEQSMAVRQRIGYLPESPPLYSDMTVEAFLHFVAELKRVSAGDRPKFVDRAIERCNLTEKRHDLIRKLSKGFKQRVGIAQALVHDPPAIVLDEPTVGLDPKQIIDVRNLIKSLAGDHTIILSTHILPEVSMTCDRVAIVNRGQVAATGTPAELTAQLAGSQQVDMEVRGDRDGICAAVRSMPDVELQELKALPEESGTSRWTVRVSKAGQSDAWIADLAATLVRAEIDIYELQRSRASLEDIFLQLTTEDATARAA